MTSLEEKIGQMLIVGFHGLEPPDYIIKWLSEGRISGIILFSRNIKNPKQLANLTKTCQEAAKNPILVAIDQEGGVVARLREGFTESPGAMALGASGSEKMTKQVSTILGTEMRALGINWNLAPAIDITHNIHNPSVGVRSLGVNPKQVAKLAIAQVKGFQKTGVAATAKHFPGKANTPIDPHVNLPVIDASIEEMWDTDLVPFRAVSNAGIAAMMITHVQFKTIDPEYPSTMSSRIIQKVLRRKIRFDGLVTTDCMEMKAITNKYGPRESAVLAAQAGANIILFSHTKDYQEKAYEALLEAAQSGRLPKEKIDYSIKKINEVKNKYVFGEKPPLNIIRSQSHLKVMEKAARAGTILLKKEENVIPLTKEKKITLIEFASNEQATLAQILKRTITHTKINILNSTNPSHKIDTYASTPEIIIIATRNAHLNPKQLKIIQMILEHEGKKILICLRNPYDAAVLDAGTIICTLGDSSPSLKAAKEVLLGQYTPIHKLPVPLETS